MTTAQLNALTIKELKAQYPNAGIKSGMRKIEVVAEVKKFLKGKPATRKRAIKSSTNEF